MSGVNSVTGTQSTLYAPSDTNPRVPQKTMDQNDFLKLLVTQFTNQDPMNPMKDTEYIAQMAQFTSLEQTKTMSSDISKLRSDNQLLQANALIGRTVELQPSTDSTTTIVGTVSAVSMEAGTPLIVVNGQPYDLSTLLTVRPTQTTQVPTTK